MNSKDDKLDLYSTAFDGVLRDIMGDGDWEFPRPELPGFEVLAKIGEGGFGAVYRARDEKLERDVAIKILHPHHLLEPNVRAQFLNEARALARVRHPHVVTIHSVLDADPQVALVMEFVEGKPLSDILEERGPFSANEAVAMGIELCQALAAVHAAGIIHRDVKTPNILRGSGGRIVLTDFGLGVILSDARSVDSHGCITGSPLFMAPEQVVGEPSDRRTDVYAVGVVLYNLASGKFPANAASVPELFEKIRTGALTPLRDVCPDFPVAFTSVVMKALRRDPKERFQTVGEMEEALVASLHPRANATSEAKTPTTDTAPLDGSDAKEQSTVATRRRRILQAAVAVVVVMMIVAAAIQLYRALSSDFRVQNATLWLSLDKGARVLNSGDTVSVGSQLYFDFLADRDLHVYVLNEDLHGRRQLMFPLNDGGLQNPLPRDERHRLPGTIDGEEFDWRIGLSGGVEHIFVIATREPWRELEQLAKSNRSPGGYPVMDATANDVVIRSVNELVPRQTQRKELLREVIDELAGRLETPTFQARDLWIRKYELPHPEGASARD